MKARVRAMAVMLGVVVAGCDGSGPMGPSVVEQPLAGQSERQQQIVAPLQRWHSRSSSARFDETSQQPPPDPPEKEISQEETPNGGMDVRGIRLLIETHTEKLKCYPDGSRVTRAPDGGDWCPAEDDDGGTSATMTAEEQFHHDMDVIDTALDYGLISRELYDELFSDIVRSYQRAGGAAR